MWKEDFTSTVDRKVRSEPNMTEEPNKNKPTGKTYIDQQ